MPVLRLIRYGNFGLNIINHGDALFESSNISWGRALLDFIIPFWVSVYKRNQSSLYHLRTACKEFDSIND